jgi:hypothetical protein
MRSVVVCPFWTRNLKPNTWRRYDLFSLNNLHELSIATLKEWDIRTKEGMEATNTDERRENGH